MATRTDVKTEIPAVAWLRNEAAYYDRTIYKETVQTINDAADVIEALLAAVDGALEHMEWSTPQGCEAYNALDDAKRKALGE